jgi:hypothetical protein
MLGVMDQDIGCAVREVGRDTRSLKESERKRASVASKAKAKRRLWRRENVSAD